MWYDGGEHVCTRHRLQMDTRKLRYFTVVAEELHFGKAALRLKMSQPPLSQQIQAFEHELGVQLFIRNRRGVQLTPVGKILLDRGRFLLQELDKVADEIREAGSGDAGELKLGHAPPADFDVLPRVISRLRAEAPRVRLSLRAANTTVLLEEVKAKQLHAAIVRLPIKKQLTLQTITITRERVVAIAPVNHPIARRKTVRFSDLSQERFIGFPRWISPAYFDQLSNLCHEHGGFTYEPSQLVETIQTALALIASGLGISLQAESTRTLDRHDVKYIDISDSPPCVETGVAFSEQDRSSILQKFLQIVRSIECEPAAAKDKTSKAARAKT